MINRPITSKLKFWRYFIFGALLFLVSSYAAINISTKLLTKIENKYGSEARSRVIAWQQLMRRKDFASEKDKLKAVNDFFNKKMTFVDDIVHWKKKDYWATPIEFLGSNGGDCEDYSIAKYFTLKELGVPESKLRITYVKALKLNQAHMVVTYYPSKNAVPLVLDNLVPKIRKASLRKDLKPVYSFNGTGLWIAKARGKGKRVGGSGRISLWQDLKSRMRENKI